MKKLKKFSALFLALAMVVGMILPNLEKVLADSVKDTTKTVTLHKILMSDEDLGYMKEGQKIFPGQTGKDGKLYTGKSIDNIKGYFGNSAESIDGVYFELKVENNKYVEHVDGNPLKAKVGENGAAVTTNDQDKAVHGLTSGGGQITFDTTGLNGKFVINEVKEKSTYAKDGKTLSKMVAVPVNLELPFVGPTGVEEVLHVYPKNTESDKPKIDKNFELGASLNIENGGSEVVKELGAKYENYGKTKATASAEIGKKIPYEVKTKIPKGADYKTIRWEDTMTQGLTYNKDFTITVTDVQDITKNDLEIKENESGFVAKVKGSSLEKIKNAAENKDLELVIKYSATVNKDAIVDQPDENKVVFNYSNRPNNFVEPKNTTTKPIEKKIKVTKTWGGAITPVGTSVKYFLYEKNSSDPSKDKVVQVKEINSGTDYSAEFDNLDESKDYYVKEVVSGYTPKYEAKNNDGTISITNTPDNDNPKPLIPTDPKVVTYGKKFVKTGESDARLPGAQFYVKNSEGKYLVPKADAVKKSDNINVTQQKEELDAAIKAYNELTAEQQKNATQSPASEKLAAIKSTQEAYNKAVKEAANAYVWEVENTNALVLYSNDSGQFEITGLERKTYKLEEKSAPEGYAKLSGEILFDVNKDSYTKDETDKAISYEKSASVDIKDALKVENKKVTIPQTGGIGTIIFAVAGIALMGLAVYAMKRNAKEEE